MSSKDIFSQKLLITMLNILLERAYSIIGTSKMSI